MGGTKIRLNVNSRSLAKAITLVSNSIVLASNSYLIGRSLVDHIRDHRRERLLSSFEIASQAVGALASLATVITNTLESHANGH